MTDPNHLKPEPRPASGQPTQPATTPSPSSPNTSSDQRPPASAGGRIVHDSRGNAVWQWVKDAGRAAIESTSILLKKLEVPELKVESKEDGELRLEDHVDPGGGYDPYGTTAGAKKPTQSGTPVKKR